MCGEKPPRPIVASSLGRKRKGKGFSKEELEEVGLTLKEALKLGIPIDKRRRTKHEENVRMLREYLKKVGGGKEV